MQAAVVVARVRMLKAPRCRRCGSTQLNHVCSSGRSAATKAKQRIEAELFGESSDDASHVNLCNDSSDDEDWDKSDDDEETD